MLLVKYIVLHITGETSCRYGTGQAPSSSKLLRDCTVHTLFESVVGPLQFRVLRYETSNGPTMDSTGVRTVWIQRSSDGYGARLVC